MTHGVRALLVVLSTALLGAVYYLYLLAEPFPAALVRLVPVVWLAASIIGGVAAARALRSDRQRVAAGLALALDLPITAFAVIFTMAALMGD